MASFFPFKKLTRNQDSRIPEKDCFEILNLESQMFYLRKKMETANHDIHIESPPPSNLGAWILDPDSLIPGIKESKYQYAELWHTLPLCPWLAKKIQEA